MTKIFLSRLHYPVTTLGPGRRIGLWMQGCSIQCAGCISPDTWDAGHGAADISSVVQMLSRWADDADGLTVSGGEPFDQPVALAEVLGAWRSRSSKSVLIFTGYERADIEPWLAVHGAALDAVMTGRFEQHAPQSKALRGSDNQSLHLLTPLGRTEFAGYERPARVDEKRLDVVFDEDGGVWFAGIPARGDMERLRTKLRAAGHKVTANTRAAHP